MEATVRATRIYTLFNIINKDENEILLKIRFQISVRIEGKKIDKELFWEYTPEKNKLVLDEWDIKWLNEEFKLEEKTTENTIAGVQLSNILDKETAIYIEKSIKDIQRDEILRTIENMLNDSKMYKLNKIQKEDTMEFLRNQYDDHQWKSLEQAVRLVFKSM